MMQRKNISNYILFSALAFLLASCEKVNITFGATASDTDPNITYFDDYQTTIATYKPDSFLTSSHKIFSIGYHYDSVFGVVKAGSFAQVSLPPSNPAAGKPVIFDSLELILKPTGEFYGDSTRSMKINVYRLSENIKTPTNTDSYYNTLSFGYDPVAIGQQTVNLNGKSGTAIHIRLVDALGQDLLNKFKTSDDAVFSIDRFIDYFKGIYINTDSTVTNSLAFFSSSTDSMLIRLTYHENTLFPEKKLLDFYYTDTKQFNNISVRHINSIFSAFINKKTQLIESTASGNQAFLNTSMGATIKISFPSLLNLKELHPYIKVVKAILVIKPDIKSSVPPYQLPKTLNLYTADDTNYPLAGIFDGGTSSSNLQTGNLVIDNLYGENTYYSYDITSFINAKIEEGQFSKSALLLYQTIDNIDGAVQRLIVNNQSNSRSIQLHLYVLGL